MLSPSRTMLIVAPLLALACHADGGVTTRTAAITVDDLANNVRRFRQDFDCQQAVLACIQRAAGDVGAIVECRAEFEACLDDGGGGTGDDGGTTGGAPPDPADDCTEALQDCIAGGGDPATCADQARECIADTQKDACDAHVQLCEDLGLPSCEAIRMACEDIVGGLPGGGSSSSSGGFPGGVTGGGLPGGGSTDGTGGGIPTDPAACIAELNACIAAGTDPVTCADQARACLGV